MRDGHCPKCGANAVHEIDTSDYADRGIPLSSWHHADLTYYVCTACGYTEMYVLDEKARQRIARDKPRAELEP